MEIIIHTDGGSLGNPGPSAIGVVIEYDGQKKTYGKDIGVGTNNEAEYKALIFALRKTKALLGGSLAKKAELKCFMDSQLVESQLNHKYHLKNERTTKLFVEVWNLMLEFKSVEFNYVPREENQEADSLIREVYKTFDQKTLF